MAPPGVGDSYDEDDFVDQYDSDIGEEGEDELSPEDRAAMDKGTAEVRQALGDDANKVTLKQIQDALWHYYYDVEKSIGYLTKTFIAPPPPKPTPKKAPDGKSRLFSFYTGHGLGGGASGADHENLERDLRLDLNGFSSCSTEVCFSILERPHLAGPIIDFSDMPWLNIPKHRETIFIKPPSLPGGLLGGGEDTPKVSKLQALAAARRKKNEEKKGQEKASQAERGIKRLSLSDGPHKENMRPVINQSKSPKLSEEPAQPKNAHDIQATQLGRLEKHQGQGIPDEPTKFDGVADRQGLDEGTHGANPEEVVSIARNHTPSAFAQTLLGSTPEGRQRQRPNTFAMPHTSSSSFLATAFSEPSPDDIVLAAQAKAGKKTPSTPKATKKAPKKDDASKKTDVVNGVSNLKISDAPPPKSKGLDVIKEFENHTSKRSISFVVVGHVDAGKSTLMGRLLLELKFVEERTVEKYRRQAEKSGKQSFALAWVMDQRSEERERGVTIDIATNHFETETTKFTILDAPGHRDFVPNMIAGASQADLAILVIDANTGAYEKGLKGQTREHVLLLRSLGVQRLIVAVNKLDMVDWSQERFEEISQQVTGFLTGLGFQGKHINFIPISGLNGGNIAQKVEDSAASWYKGATLIETLEASEPSAARALKKPFRMAISEVFRSQQGTTTLAGRIDSGTTQIGDVVLVQPSGETAYIKSIVVDADSQEWAVAGQIVSIALTDIDPIHIRVGDIVCHTTDPINCGDSFTMKAMAFDHLMPMPVDLHRGRLHVAGQIQSLVATLDKTTGEIVKKRPKVVQPGGVARIVVKLEAKVPLEKGQRVVIRSGGETIAAGLLE